MEALVDHKAVGVRAVVALRKLNRLLAQPAPRGPHSHLGWEATRAEISVTRRAAHLLERRAAACIAARCPAAGLLLEHDDVEVPVLSEFPGQRKGQSRPLGVAGSHL
jgi:hypothetical protein